MDENKTTETQQEAAPAGNKKKGIIVGAIAAVVVAAGVAIAFLTGAPKGITMAVTNLPDSLNPVLEQNMTGLNANELVFDGLFNFEVLVDDSDETNCIRKTEYALVEEIIQEDDRMTFDITLRDGIAWHDNTEDNPHFVTADDVEFSFNAYVNAENKSPNRDYLRSFIKKVEVIDNLNLKVVFQQPIPDFRAYNVLTFKIIPCEYNGAKLSLNLRAGDNERMFQTAPVGTGPFRLDTWQEGKWLTFSRNGMYKNIKKTPQAETIVIKRTIDPVVRMNELAKGTINMIPETNPMDRSIAAKIEGIGISTFMPYAFYQVDINTKLFPNAEGRRAMAMALDRTSVLPGITDEEGCVINNGPVPSNTFERNVPEYFEGPMPNNLPYDLSQANKLAKKGGIADQNAILIFPDSMGEFGQQVADGIASQLKKIGLNVEVKRTGDQVFERMVKKEKSYELALMYYDGFSNTYNEIEDLYIKNGSKNYTGVSNKKLDELIKTWGNTTETGKWIDLTIEVDKAITDICPAIPLFTVQKEVYSKGLKGVVIASDNPFLSAEDWEFN